MGQDHIEVKRLQINYKTLEEFEKFREYGLEELSMLEDLQANIIEDDSNSPFYGIYFGDKLVARMSLYHISAKYDRYFDPPNGYLELWKLEVLPGYRNLGYGSALVEYAKSFEQPVKTNARQQSGPFWKQMGFKPVKYNPVRDRGESPYIWLPEGVKEQILDDDDKGVLTSSDADTTQADTPTSDAATATEVHPDETHPGK